MLRPLMFTTAIVMLATGFSSNLAAQVQVGDAIEFSYSTIDGNTVSTKDLQGRIVIVEHWATWCGPCVAAVPHLKKLHETYSPRGVVLIGVSHDRGTAEVERFIKAQSMNWPQVMNTQTRGGPNWGVRGIPHAFIISPDGKLLWRGHPMQMDVELEKAIREHPPRSQRASGGISDVLRAAHQALDDKDYTALLDAIDQIPDEAMEDRAMRPRLISLGRRLNSPVVEVEALQSTATNRVESMRKLTQLATLAVPAGSQATLGGRGDRAGEGRVNAAMVTARLERAHAARENEQHVEAYRLYKWVADRAEGDERQAQARERVDAYEADEAFMAELRRVEQAEAARALLALAHSYVSADQKDLAIQSYQKIVDEYPNTEEATAAREALAKLKS